MLAIFINGMDQPFDSRMYFYCPGQHVGWCIHYGMISYIEMAELRAAQTAQDSIPYGVQSMKWCLDDMVVMTIDGKGNLAMFLRANDACRLQQFNMAPAKFIRTYSSDGDTV